MKKKITAVILLAALVLSMTGCGNKSVLHISVEGIGDYEVVQIPTGTVNYSKTDEEGITMTVKKNGEYAFVVRGDDGQKYAFTLNYQDGNAEIQTEDNITVKLSVE